MQTLRVIKKKLSDSHLSLPHEMKKMTINENKKTDERIKSPKYSQNKWRQEDEILDIWNYDIKVNEYIDRS